MALFIRHFLVCMLSVVLSAGQIPAWIHVAECHGVSSAEVHVVSPCSHGCQHHQSSEPESTDSKDSGDPNEHDSDSCAICQSLALAPDLLPELEFEGVIQPLTENACVPSLEVRCIESFPVPQPRGPPRQVS